MQELTYVQTTHGRELYCAMCDTLFDEQFVKMNIPAFCDIHRDIHKRMSLDTPDLPDNLDTYQVTLTSYPQNYIELSTANQDLSTDLSTEIDKLSTD